jgi:hypothetical protein
MAHRTCEYGQLTARLYSFLMWRRVIDVSVNSSSISKPELGTEAVRSSKTPTCRGNTFTRSVGKLIGLNYKPQELHQTASNCY